MSVRKSGSRAVSLKSSALPEAIRPAQCWSLGCQSPTRSGKLKARTCWRMTSGWKSGLDSSAICWATAYAETEKSQAYWRCGKSGPSTGKADRKMEDRNISVPDLSVSSFQAVHRACISPAKGRMQQARAKPPKATTRPPQGHILGIDSGVQSHHKATPRPPQSHILWSTEAPQGHPKATPRLHQGHPKAPPRPPPCDPKATPKPGEGLRPVGQKRRDSFRIGWARLEGEPGDLRLPRRALHSQRREFQRPPLLRPVRVGVRGQRGGNYDAAIGRGQRR